MNTPNQPAATPARRSTKPPLLRTVAVAVALMTGLGLGSGSRPAFAGDAGISDTEIRIGASVVLSGPLGPQTQAYGEGSRLVFDAVNAHGGVHGRKIRYTTLDDGFDIAKATENTRQLLGEERVFLIYNNTGTGHTAAILPLAAEHKTVVFSPLTGAAVFREQFNRHLFHVRASYADEAKKMVEQFGQVGTQRVALAYQNDAFGKALQAELRKAASAANLTLVAEVAVDPKQPDFAAAATALAAATPQAIVMGTGGTTFTQLVQAVQKTTARPVYFGYSVAGLEVIKKELGPAARGIVLAQVMPALQNVSLGVVTDYRQLLKAKDPQATPSAPQLEGFVQARVLVEGLRRAGRGLTTESFITAMESLGEVSMGKFVARYSPRDHNGSSYVELAIIDAAGHLRY